MRIIGIGFLSESSVALLENGKIKYAISQERLNRIKNWWGNPIETIKFVLKETGYKLEDIDPSYLATISLLIGFIIAFPFTFINGGIDLDQEFRVLLSIFLLGTLCTGLGYIGHMFLIKRIGPVRATTSLFIVPISGMFLGNMFLSESITLFMILGCILILIGVAMTNLQREN